MVIMLASSVVGRVKSQNIKLVFVASQLNQCSGEKVKTG